MNSTMIRNNECLGKHHKSWSKTDLVRGVRVVLITEDYRVLVQVVGPRISGFLD